MQALAFVAGNMFAVALSMSVARFLTPAARGLAYAMSSATMFVVVVCVVMEGLAQVGLLNWGACVIALGLLATAAAVIGRRWGERDRWMPAAEPDVQARARPFAHASFIPAWFAFAILFVHVAIGGILGGVSFNFDDLYYHAVPVADWLRSGTLATSPTLGVHGYYPKGAELVTLWFVLPFHQDAYASLVGVFWLVLILLAAIVLIGRSRADAATAVAAGALLLASAVTGEPAHSFSAVDLAGPAATLVAIALTVSWSVYGDRSNHPEDAYPGRRAVAVGLACGLAMSARPQFIVALIACAAVLALQPGPTARPRWRLVLLTMLGAFVTGAYWYVRNLVLTGNPMFPMSIGPFAGFIPKEEAAISTLWYSIAARPLSLDLWQTLAWEHLRWPWPIGLVSVAGYATLVLAPWRRRGRRGIARNLTPDYLLGAVGLGLFLLYVWLPFAGTHGGVDAPLRIAIRYVVAPFVIGLVLAARFVTELGSGRTRAMVTAAAGIVAVTSAGYIPAAVVVAALIAAAIVWQVMAWRRPPLAWARALRPATTLALVAVGCLALATYLPIKQRRTNDGLFGYNGARFPIGQAWAALESLRDGTRIAWFGHYPGDGQYYALFGRRLQHRPVVLAADGTPYSLAREVPSIRPGRRELTQPLSAETFLDNLQANQVDVVLVSKYWKLFPDYQIDPDPPWPAQMSLLEQGAAQGRAVSLWQDGYSALWRLQDQGGSKRLASGVRGR